MSVEDAFGEAARRGRLARLTETTGEVREVEPYMVFVSARGQRQLHFYQLRGESRSGQRQGWKCMGMERIAEAEVLGESFSPRDDYNPFNEKLFPEVVFALDAGGRPRAAGPAARARRAS